MRPTFINKNQFLDIKKISLGEKESIENDEEKNKYVEHMIKKSQAMVKKWKDSYEKKLEQEEREIKAKMKAKESSLIEFYNKLMEEKQRKREKLISDTKDTFFKQNDEPRQLESALLCAEMLKEQQAQREFNKNLKEKEKQKNLEYSKFINTVSKDWLDDQLKKHKLRVKKNIEESLLVKEQAEKRRQSEIERKKQKIILEKEDMEKAKEENDKLKETTMKMKKEECEKFKEYIKSGMNEVNDRKMKEKELNRKENELIEIQQNARLKLREMRMKRDIEIAREKTKARDAVKNKIIVNDREKELKEEKKIQKAQEDYKKREIEMLQKEIEEIKRKKDERIKYYQEWLEEEKTRKQIMDESKKLEIENSLENMEYTKKMNNKLRKEQIKKTIENKLFILEQQKELAEKKVQEKKDRYEFYTTNMSADMKAADEKFFTYANQLLLDCEAKGRPRFPLDKVIKEYKTRYMQPDRKIPKHLRTHMNCDLRHENN